MFRRRCAKLQAKHNVCWTLTISVFEGTFDSASNKDVDKYVHCILASPLTALAGPLETYDRRFVWNIDYAR